MQIDLSKYKLTKIESVTKGKKLSVFDITLNSPEKAFIARSPDGSKGISHNSATISLSNLSDDRMRNAKSGQWWIDNPQRALANNSVCYTEKPDVGIFMDEWRALYTSKSGERGIFNRRAAKKQAEKTGRRNSDQDWGTNPCLDGDTLIYVADGRGYVSIKTLAEENKDVPVFCYDHSGKIVVSKMRNPRRTGTNKKIMEMEIEGGYKIRCTENHKFRLRDGNYIEIKDLPLGEILNIIKNDEIYECKIISIQDVGYDDVYNGTVDSYHNYFVCVEKDEQLLLNVKNCGEILLPSKSFCNLSEVVIRSNDSQEDIKRKVRLATILGTFQSTLTNFKYLRKDWARNCTEERLLGVSLTGIMDNSFTSKISDDLKEFLNELKLYAINTNEQLANELNINPSMSITCCKPSGTVSQLCNSSSGIHARHSKFYIRSVRADNKDPLCQFMKDQNFPHEPELMNPNNVTVFYFPVQSPSDSIFRNDRGAIEQLEFWLLYKTYWCEHNPSVTISVKEDEWLDVAAWVYKNFDDISGVSFLPFSDYIYQQAPYEECTEEKYQELLEKIPKNIDWFLLKNYENFDNTLGAQTPACSGNSCDIVDLK